MKIAVIGGSGFIGGRLIKRLSAEHRVLNIDRVQRDDLPCESVVGDVRSPASFASQLAGYDLIILLAAEHRDDVSPVSLYYDVNVEGMRNVLAAMDEHGITRLVFTSTVAVYGIDRESPPGETDALAPFNDYGVSKMQAEALLNAWQAKDSARSALVLRPTVLFGEGNRGNVYNLLNMVHSGKFLMIGNGKNRKSMAYVGNFVAFLQHSIRSGFQGLEVFNFVDTPDMNMNTLVAQIYAFKGKPAPRIRLPYFIGITAGYFCDVLSKLVRKPLPVSSTRVRKFCASTEINATKMLATGFVAPIKLEDSIANTLKHEFSKR